MSSVLELELRSPNHPKHFQRIHLQFCSDSFWIYGSNTFQLLKVFLHFSSKYLYIPLGFHFRDTFSNLFIKFSGLWICVGNPSRFLFSKSRRFYSWNYSGLRSQVLFGILLGIFLDFVLESLFGLYPMSSSELISFLKSF